MKMELLSSMRNAARKGAIYNLYAAEDIKTPDGAVVYQAGALVKENLVTGDDGSVTVTNLHLGTYRVTEIQAPENFYNAGEEKNGHHFLCRPDCRSGICGNYFPE